MVKFIKKIKRGSKVFKNSLKLKAMFKGQQGLYTFYSIWFSTINAYIKGKPSWTKKQAWKVYVVPFIPSTWVCTDKGNEGITAKRRCKLIQHRMNKTGKVILKDKKWLKTELLPAFEEDFAKKNLDMDKLGEVNDEKIEVNIKKIKSNKKFKELK